MANDWENGLCGCFANFGVCLITYFLPCITVGQNAEEAGTCGCMLAGILTFVPLVNFYVIAKTRADVREKHNIAGSMLSDLLTTLFCSLCVIIQTKNQLSSGSMGEDIARV